MTGPDGIKTVGDLRRAMQILREDLPVSVVVDGQERAISHDDWRGVPPRLVLELKPREAE